MANKVRVAFVQRQSVADKDISALKVVPDLGLEVEAKRDRIGISVGCTHKVVGLWLPGDGRERWERLVPAWAPTPQGARCLLSDLRNFGLHADEGPVGVLL